MERSLSSLTFVKFMCISQPFICHRLYTTITIPFGCVSACVFENDLWLIDVCMRHLDIACIYFWANWSTKEHWMCAARIEGILSFLVSPDSYVVRSPAAWNVYECEIPIFSYVQFERECMRRRKAPSHTSYVNKYMHESRAGGAHVKRITLIGFGGGKEEFLRSVAPIFCRHTVQHSCNNTPIFNVIFLLWILCGIEACQPACLPTYVAHIRMKSVCISATLFCWKNVE